MPLKTCPRCQIEGSLNRVSKKGFSRFLSRFTEVHHYRCDNFSCKWDGLILPKFNEKTLTQVLLPYLLGLGFVALVLIGGYSFFSYSAKTGNQESQQQNSLNSNETDVESSTANGNYK